MKTFSAFLILITCFISNSAWSQITLVKDIRVGSIGSLINNPEFVVFNNALYFLADDGVHGKELWKTDGTTSGTVLVKDIVAGSGSSFPANLTVSGNLLYFTANDGVFGKELWKSDGTFQGTVMVKNIDPGINTPSHPNSLFDYNGTLFFGATNGNQGLELWKSDGTENGTIMVRDINEGNQDSMPGNFSIHNNYLYFSATTGQQGRELFRTAGDELSTVLVSDIYPGSSGSGANSSNPSAVISLGNNPYFTAANGPTRTLMTISGNQSTAAIVSIGNNVEWLTKSGNSLFYRAFNSISGTELYVSNGVIGGASLVKDIRSGNANSSPSGFVDANGTLFFRADNGINGVELWKSDGTEEGTMMVKDIMPGATGSASSNSSLGKMIQNKLFFRANDGVHGNELWVSDGTENGTYMVMDLNPGSGFSEPWDFIEFNNSVYFTATTSTTGRELYKLDLANLSTANYSTKNNSFQHYYNPNQKTLTVLNIEEKSNLKLFDISGKEISKHLVTTPSIEINLNGLAKGIYIIKLENNTFSETKKFVVY